MKHFCSVSSLDMRVGYTSTSQNESDNAWSGATPRPPNRRRCGRNDLQAYTFDFFLGSQRDELRALHAQREHCDQCHLLIVSEGKSEASYSPEEARAIDDGSVSPTR